MQDASPGIQDIRFEEGERAGIVTLTRPHVLNAVTLEMLRGLEAHRHKWAKNPKIYCVILQAEGSAFSAGGDIRWLHGVLQAGRMDEALQYYREEYQHCWTLESFNKPNVALINGLVMGGGAGICVYGTHRVAGEDFRFAMPETGIGFFPDIGGSFFLSRMPGEMGVYLGLTGEAIGPADAWHLGIVSHCIPAGEFDGIRTSLTDAQPVDAMLNGMHRDPGPGTLMPLKPLIDRIFSAVTVEEILQRLDRETGEFAGWAQETAANLRKRAPLSLKVTLRQIREGKNNPRLKEALQMEFRLACRFLAGHDFREGIRAAVIGKDRAPRWQHAGVCEVTDGMVDACFAPLNGGELELRDYWTLED